MTESTNFINFSALRSAAADDDDIFRLDPELSLGQNIVTIISKQFCLPKMRLQIPIIASYFLMPSQLTSTVPVLLLEGKEGTGKTDLMLFGAGIYGVQVQNAAWTYAALRNEITHKRDGNSEFSEQAYMLFLDNLNPETLKNENIYTLLLCGYSRKSSIVKIAKSGGLTIDFDTYCPKVCSTVHNLLGDPSHRELKRRCLVIRTKHWKEISTKDEISSEFDVSNYQSLDGLDLYHLQSTYSAFWRENANIAEYLLQKKKLNKSLKGFQLKGLILDLLTTMIVTEVLEEDEAIDTVKRFLDWQASTESDSALLDCIKNFIAEENKPYAEVGIEIKEINPKRLKDAITFLANEGALDVIPTPQLIATGMASLGWTLKSGKWRKV